MSRAYHPLTEGHPAIGAKCLICERPIAVGDVTTLIPVSMIDRHTADAALAHASCAGVVHARDCPCPTCRKVPS